MLDIASNEDYLMDSLQHFDEYLEKRPPHDKSVDKSISVFGERALDRSALSAMGPGGASHRVIAGVKL